MSETDPQLSDADLAAVTALADGRLRPSAAAALRARFDGEPALAVEFERQHRAVSIMRAATEDVFAPHALRVRIENERAKAPTRAGRRRWWLPVGAAGIVSAAAIAIVLVISVSRPPSVDDILGAASHTATIGVSVSQRTPQLLTTAIEGVPFPNFAAKFGWKATGARTERIGGRPATTVFYERDGRELAYTIVGGDALDTPEGERTTVNGKKFTVWEADSRTAVTWQRRGHTCVLSGDGVGADELVGLAGWNGKGNIPF